MIFAPKTTAVNGAVCAADSGVFLMRFSLSRSDTRDGLLRGLRQWLVRSLKVTGGYVTGVLPDSMALE